MPQSKPLVLEEEEAISPTVGPSGFYRADLWKLGLSAARVIPARALVFFARHLALGYALANRTRVGIVSENLRPIYGSETGINAAAKRTFSNLGVKLADLWRYEAGLSLDDLFSSDLNLSQLAQFEGNGRGTLLLTPHIGNWEFGAPLLGRHNIKLVVITQAEPQDVLTQMRKASRERWGIETLVIGENPFAFVEVIRRLEAGATVALLVDRPASASAVRVSLFGNDFNASVAAAELARASNCRLLPVSLPRVKTGYKPVVLPLVEYNRAELGNRGARIQLTQRIMRLFEPVIREYADQWYHFIPIWDTQQSS